MYNRSYRLDFYDTASPTNYTLLEPAVVILCYSIADPASLASLHKTWKTILEVNFGHNENLPVIVLGLCRDVREQQDYDGKVRRNRLGAEGENEMLHERHIVYPQEALAVAQAMRCDKYCECSALTGEVCTLKHMTRDC